MKKLIISAIAIAFLITGCATPYDQKKSAWTGGVGFSETQIGPDLWQIDFTGNTYTDRDTTKKYVLRKAAEVSMREGYPYFRTAESATSRDVTGANNAGYYNGWGGGQTYANAQTTTNITVQLLKTKEGQGNGIVYDANFLLSSVPPK